MRGSVVLWPCLVLACAAGCTGLAGVDATTFAEPKADHITFWGHACSYIDIDGVGILTDPVFEKNLWNRRRIVGAPPTEIARRARVILISHAHNDHFSPSTIKAVAGDAIVLAPSPVANSLSDEGVRVREMKPGDELEMDGVRFVAVAAHHPGERWSLDAKADGRALGWVIITPAVTIFYSGDTDYCSSFRQVGQSYAPDIAILNVNGHLKPPDTARAARDTGAHIVIPAHWGAYKYYVLGGNKRPHGEQDLRRLLGDRLHVLNVGESISIAPGGAR
jgi:L-ascorbate metabolism protein UlaG (beta-lactamase superfamily)